LWPACGSDLETRRASRERGRSLKAFSAVSLSVTGGSSDLDFFEALAYAGDCRARIARLTVLGGSLV
jgi:hypothetical protein